MSEISSGGEPGGRGGIPPFVGAAASDAAAEIPRKAADTIVRLVDALHDKAVRPAILLTRAVVFGLVIAVLSIVVLVLGSVALLRFLDVYAFGHRVWLSYVVIGGVTSLSGLALWSRRSVRRAPGAN